jgi:hypothetical protein
MTRNRYRWNMRRRLWEIATNYHASPIGYVWCASNALYGISEEKGRSIIAEMHDGTEVEPATTGE